MSIERIIYARVETFFVVAVVFVVAGQIALHSGGNYNPGDAFGPAWERLMNLAHDALNGLAVVSFFCGSIKLIINRYFF